MSNRISSNKKENEKKKISKRLEKQKRKDERKANNSKKNFEDMIAYIRRNRTNHFYPTRCKNRK